MKIQVLFLVGVLATALLATEVTREADPKDLEELKCAYPGNAEENIPALTLEMANASGNQTTMLVHEKQSPEAKPRVLYRGPVNIAADPEGYVIEDTTFQKISLAFARPLKAPKNQESQNAILLVGDRTVRLVCANKTTAAEPAPPAVPRQWEAIVSSSLDSVSILKRQPQGAPKEMVSLPCVSGEKAGKKSRLYCSKPATVSAFTIHEDGKATWAQLHPTGGGMTAFTCDFKPTRAGAGIYCVNVVRGNQPGLRPTNRLVECRGTSGTGATIRRFLLTVNQGPITGDPIVTLHSDDAKFTPSASVDLLVNAPVKYSRNAETLTAEFGLGKLSASRQPGSSFSATVWWYQGNLALDNTVGEMECYP